MKIGILTGGGDCPGLNAVIRAVVRKAVQNKDEVFAFEDGWKGIVESRGRVLDINSVSGILYRGGTIIGTSRNNPLKDEGGEERIENSLKQNNIDALIVVGGEDTLGVASIMIERGLPMVGVPKTIDNDLSGTDVTFGFDTAINIAMEAIDRVHTTAESHNRVIVVEVMGRETGWIALYSGLAGGADVIIIPEHPVGIEKICEIIQRRHSRGKLFSIVVVSEGAKVLRHSDGEEIRVKSTKVDEFGHIMLGGIGYRLAEIIEELTGYETRAAILGHIQRGGTPTAADRMLGTRFGVKAYDLVKEGRWGKMAALRGTDIVDVELKVAVEKLKTVDTELYKLAEVFFG